MINIVGNRRVFFIITAIVILVCAISLATFGLRAGVEFSSGSALTVDFEDEVTQDELEEELVNLGYKGAIVQEFMQGGGYLLRLPRLSSVEKDELEEGLTARFGALAGEAAFEKDVDPIIAAETTQNAAIAVAVAAVGILLYIAWAFRRMPNPFRYGTCAIIALVHDTLVALGVFSILGGTMGWEIDLSFVIGILAVIGYSVNNTVVVFDRIRENLSREGRIDFETTVNSSLVETLSRSLNTSLTTLFVVLALMLFVGASIQNFAVVLLIGIIAGTYSSLCIAPALLVVWRNRERRRAAAQ
ncbi:protein translocase subunit SecF [Chloroflexota bacterium]